MIIILPTLFSPGVAALLQNMVLRPQTYMSQPALGGFVIKATVRDHFRRYQQSGLPGLLHIAYQGSDCVLTDTDLVALNVHVQAHLYLTTKDAAAWVDEEFGVTYTASEMSALLHRLGFVYKKPKRMPGKADPNSTLAIFAVGRRPRA